MRLVVVTPGERLPEPSERLAGAVLARDLVVRGERWSKGRRLSAADLDALIAGGSSAASGAGRVRTVALLVPEAGDLHEDDAALRLAGAVAGPGVALRGPSQSRVDLVASHAGVVRIRTVTLGRLDAIDGLSVFTVLDGQLVAAGEPVGAVKTGPHLVPESAVARAAALAAGARPVVEVRPYRACRVAAIVKETLAPAARARFEGALRSKVEGLGSRLLAIAYVADDPGSVEAAFRRFGRGRERADLVLTAGAASTDPSDAIHVAFAAIGGRVTSHGVPAHPGSMLWLGRAGRTAYLGLPTCGAYSKATAADLLLPWLLAGEPPDRRTVARLGHGGLLTRQMRFRFPPYARELDAPEG